MFATLLDTNGDQVYNTLQGDLSQSIGGWIYGILGFLIWATVAGFAFAGYATWHKNHIKAGDQKKDRPAWKDLALGITGLAFVIIISIVATCMKQQFPPLYEQWMSLLTLHWIGGSSTTASTIVLLN